MSETEFHDASSQAGTSVSDRDLTVVNRPDQTDDNKSDQENNNSETVDPDNISGYDKVDKLASYLFSLRDQTAPLSNDQADYIMLLWSKLSDFEKQPTVPLPRHKTRLTKGSTTTFKMMAKIAVYQEWTVSKGHSMVVKVVWHRGQTLTVIWSC